MQTLKPYFLLPALGLLAWLVYRRIRRNFGAQRLMPLRMSLRLGLLLIVAASLLPSALTSTSALLVRFSGLAVGMALGVWGASRTRFITRAGALYYVPHTYSGLVITALVLGRLGYRLATLDDGTAGAPREVLQSPATAATLFVLVGYYAVYYSRLLYKSQHLKSEDIEPASSALS